jgi:hypothetical protein
MPLQVIQQLKIIHSEADSTKSHMGLKTWKRSPYGPVINLIRLLQKTIWMNQRLKN